MITEQELKQKMDNLRTRVSGRTIKDICWGSSDYAWFLLLDDHSELCVYDIGASLYQGDVELAAILFEE